MNRYVLDTSTALAWYLPESFSGSARDWQSRMLTGVVRFVVPSLHYWEFGNVLRTYVRRGELEEDVAREIYDLHLSAPLAVQDPDRRDVLGIALDYEATVYDAVFISLSLILDCPFVTAEKTTRPWIVKLGDRAISVVR